MTLTLTGPNGSITVNVDGAGNFSVSGLEAGDYLAVGQWTGGDETQAATGAEKFGTVSINGDSTTSFTFSS